MSISIEKINMDLVLNNANASSVLATDSNKKIVSVSNTNASSSSYLAGDLTWKVPSAGSGPTLIYITGATLVSGYSSFITSTSGVTLSSANLSSTKSYIFAKKYVDAISSGHHIYEVNMQLVFSSVTGNNATPFTINFDFSSFISETLAGSNGDQIYSMGNYFDLEYTFMTIISTTAKTVSCDMKSWSNVPGRGAYVTSYSFLIRT